MEDNSAFLFDDKESTRAVYSSVATWHNQEGGFGDSGEGKEGLLPDILLSVEGLGVLLEKESQYMPESDYLDRLRSGGLDIVARKEAIDWIKKVGMGAINSFSVFF